MSNKPPETLKQAIKEFKQMIAEMPHFPPNAEQFTQVKVIIMQRILLIEHLIEKELNEELN